MDTLGKPPPHCNLLAPTLQDDRTGRYAADTRDSRPLAHPKSESMDSRAFIMDGCDFASFARGQAV